MDPLSDLLSKKAEDLFTNDPLTANNIDEEKKTEIKPESSEHTAIDIPKLKAMIHAMKDQMESVLRLLGGQPASAHTLTAGVATLDTGERIVEGVFTGDRMMGSDGKEYTVPPNYASKSKLVEGDIMKLTITRNGSFIYKQISPVERVRVTGELMTKEPGQWSVLANGKPYKILTASATFYKGVPGDDVVILIPKDGGLWGAVEHIMHKT